MPPAVRQPRARDGQAALLALGKTQRHETEEADLSAASRASRTGRSSSSTTASAASSGPTAAARATSSTPSSGSWASSRPRASAATEMTDVIFNGSGRPQARRLRRGHAGLRQLRRLRGVGSCRQDTDAVQVTSRAGSTAAARASTSSTTSPAG